MFEAVRNIYRFGKITKAQVAAAVTKGYITAEQYTAITGDPYTA